MFPPILLYICTGQSHQLAPQTKVVVEVSYLRNACGESTENVYRRIGRFGMLSKGEGMKSGMGEEVK